MNILKKFFNKSVERKSTDEPKENFYEKNKDLPVDERFIENFKHRGGRFLYALNEQEVQDYFNNILLEHDLYERPALCFDTQLSKRFDDYNLKYHSDHYKQKCDLFLTTCHYLIADKGTLLFSSEQIKGEQLSELPDFFIVLAKASQLVENTTEALQNIKRHSTKIPSNIKPLENFKASEESEGNLMSYGTSSKVVYLIMVEDL